MSVETVMPAHSRVTVSRHASATAAESSIAWDLLRAAGSLKITVVMFLAAVFLLFVGTLAQDEMNMPEVKAVYFNSWVAWIPFADFFPVTIFPDFSVPGSFPFPGGATIGMVMLANLVAAKVTRFHVAAKGQRLVWGSVLSLVGGLVTAGVILTGHQADGLQGKPPFDYAVVWRMVQAGGVLLAVGLAAAAYVAKTGLARRVAGTAALVLAALTWITIFGGRDWQMNEPSLRIMWQLIQSSVASLLLLAGLVVVFGQRGGNVLIHLAVGLLMVGQFAFGDRQIEERMTIVQGETTNMVCRTDEVELAVVTPKDGKDQVTAISGRLLQARVGGEKIEIKGLPFSIRVVEYFRNSDVVGVGPVAPNTATAGAGKKWLASGRPPEGGASSRTNIASAYVQLTERSSGRDLGTFLVSQYLNDQSQVFGASTPDELDAITVDGDEWKLGLRFRREYKPYSVMLEEVRRINYSASDTPRDYSSYVTFTDLPTGEQLRGQRIWMNNPVRYRGETFYQSSYSELDAGNGAKTKMTGLQVVENAGWLVPYVACVLAFWGMLAHFGSTFLRFADRHERAPSTGMGDHPINRRDRIHVIHATQPRFRYEPGTMFTPALAVTFVASLALLAAVQRPPRGGVADFAAAGRIPAMHEGRIKPLDTVARNIVQLLSNKTTVTIPADTAEAGPTGRVTATQWLLATMAGSGWAARAPVFRIDAKEVVDLFDLEHRSGHRYSYAEIEPKREDFRLQIESLRKLPREQQTFVQRKFTEFEQKLMAYDLIRYAYDTPAMPPLPGDDASDREAFGIQMRRWMQGARLIEANHPPAAIPPAGPDSDTSGTAGQVGPWQALYPAIVTALESKLRSGESGQPGFQPNPAIVPLAELLAAVDADGPTFNAAVASYTRAAGELDAYRQVAGKAATEAWFNTFNPTDLAKWLYVAATVLCFAGFLAGGDTIRRFSWWLIASTFVLHTVALAIRVWITGRPPVVNLYSSAVFIGWACVGGGLFLERLHGMGIGNLLAAIAGGLTLMVAYSLDSGDTMHVLQAVLDTQFWLSTHVITVTLGYGATFLAGLLGTSSIVHGMWTRWRGTGASTESREIQDRLFRMNYGVVCFALFFSFIGTVLGGLWADDSWGRFWGWDPKENGALMIVLWNAAVLHARWDRWIGSRGFALFTIGGNIVTAWSWFGTNQLDFGLHSYGRNNDVLMILGAYVASQLVLLAAAGLFARRPAMSSA
jgi:ABC-type transport system involved in cytochrome c biogenesis permease subunit